MPAPQSLTYSNRLAMKSNYKRLGDYIRQIDVRNRDLAVDNLLGLSVNKVFMPSIANTIGTDMSNYKIVNHRQFVYIPDTSRRGDKIAIALLDKWNEAIVSAIYTVFEVIDEMQLLPEYLMMWFRRPEFDRYARFKSHGSAREIFEWDEMCEVMLPLPSIEEQWIIVAEYQTVERRIENNRRLIAALEYAAKTIYRKMFVDNIDPNNLPSGWRMGTIRDFCSKIASGATPSGGKGAYKKNGIALIRSMNVHDYHFNYSDLAKIDQAQAMKLNNVVVEKNDILFNITGVSVARCCRVPNYILPARVNQHVMILRPRHKFSSAYLLMTLLNTKNKAELLGISEGGSTREAITKKDIEDFSILIPNHNTVIEFNSKVENMFAYQEQLEQEIILLEHILSLNLAKLSNL